MPIKKKTVPQFDLSRAESKASEKNGSMNPKINAPTNRVFDTDLKKKKKPK